MKLYMSIFNFYSGVRPGMRDYKSEMYDYIDNYITANELLKHGYICDEEYSSLDLKEYYSVGYLLDDKFSYDEAMKILDSTELYDYLELEVFLIQEMMKFINKKLDIRLPIPDRDDIDIDDSYNTYIEIDPCIFYKLGLTQDQTKEEMVGVIDTLIYSMSALLYESVDDLLSKFYKMVLDRKIK